MKRVKAGILGLSMWWCTAAASADEIIWRATPPVAVSVHATAPQTRAPVVSVLRPVALAGIPKAEAKPQILSDPHVVRASLAAPAQKAPALTVRAQKEDGPPRELPDLFESGSTSKPSSESVNRTIFAADTTGPSLDPDHVLPIVPAPIDLPAKKAPAPDSKPSSVAPAKPAGEKPASLPEFPLAAPDAAAVKSVDPKAPADKPAPKAPAPKPEEWNEPAPEKIADPPEEWQGPAPSTIGSPALPALVDAVDVSCCSPCGVEGDACESFEAGHGGGLYARGEYLLWQIRNAGIPALVTTGPVGSSGILGSGGIPLLGPGSLDQRPQSGGRFTVGYWLDSCETVGVEASAFFLGETSRNFAFNGNQFPLLARPFFRLNPPLVGEATEISTSPGLAGGTVSVAQSSRLWGAEANARLNLCRGCEYHVDFLAGFRYLDLTENLGITEDLQATPGGSRFGGDHVVVADSFRTRDQFYGGQLGVDAEWSRGPWYVEGRGKVALGVTHQTIDIMGTQTITPPGGPAAVTPGGLLALNSNSGHFTKNHFSVVPEVGLNVGYKVTDHLRVFAGYNFLFWSGVVRPGDQIDRGLDVNRIMHFLPPQPAIADVRPVVPFKQTDFWTQGVNLGLEYRF